MQQFDQYGTALHAGHNPGYPASHGCIRLPPEFAKRLYTVTDVGATVMIGA
jgi:lipoprotein-anchoring transpeptidase ErfK/SrfK